MTTCTLALILLLAHHSMEFEGAPAAPTVYSVKDVSAAQFIAAYAAYLQKSGKVQLPKNVELLKTGGTWVHSHSIALTLSDAKTTQSQPQVDWQACHFGRRAWRGMRPRRVAAGACHAVLACKLIVR